MHQSGFIFIGNEWVRPLCDGARHTVINPATEEVIGSVPACSAGDVDRAVAAARAAFPVWSGLTPQERGAFLQTIAHGMKARGEEFTRLITAEVGMPYKQCGKMQVAGPLYAWGLYARLAAEFEFQAKVAHSLVVREPVGVVAAITPWNYPLHQVTCKVAPALAAGCTVVLKPAESAPLSALLMADVIKEAGLPAGVFNLVTGDGPTVGEALVVHPHVDMVSFTGSTVAGKRVAELSARTVKKVALELGGKSAAVVLDDADFAAATKAIVAACFQNSGQTCSAHTRMLVSELAYEQIKPLVATAVAGYTVGDPMVENTRLGPLANRRHLERVRACIEAGIATGAELIAGGSAPPAGLARGYFVAPTAFGRVNPASALAREEIFGPVLSILCYRDEAHAVELANDTDYGLAGGVWSGDVEHALRVARQMRTGQVDINGAPFNIQAPFGGYKQSGIGRENGVYGMEEFLQYKAIQMPLPSKHA